ncbi:MAG TPA: DNA polymerase III subunit alpha, partial [Dehalococcoidia bacterium]|nr:DNA polymerase III subunit alpha [Dehalococcoidia bacterium]
EIGMFARSQKIRIGVRGSAAASLILYCLGVTDIDPLKSNLVFERFLNLERPEAPDVDFDLPDDRREEVLRFVANRYGADRVAQIITFGTLGAKAAVRDVGRALGMSYADTDRVARLIPNALHMTLERALNENNELRMAFESDSQVRNLVEQAQKLEGVARNASTHAAGVVISAEPLVEHLPLARPARGDAQAMPTTQYAMEPVAAIGLVKMDLLGLSNLTILQRAVELIAEHQGVDVDLELLPDGDEKAFAMLATGETFGVFQMESAGMRRAVLELKPTSVDDLAALVALYRPGPMQHIGQFCRAKNGLEEVKHPHPDLADILDPTYGVIVYQDQVLKIAQKFGGYSLGGADIMRKAMGKKIAYLMLEQKDKFTNGAIEKGYSREDAQKVFELIEPFAGYAFNKAHSYSYGTIAYQTAWLKANYPEEYLTAVLKQADSHPSGTHERIAQAYNECVRLGIPVLPPDVNKSMVNFSLEDTEDGKTAIRYGLSMIKNVGQGAAESILDSRAASAGAFPSLDDFCRVLNTHSVNKRALESLVKAGCLDSVAGTDARGALLVNLDRILGIAQSEQKLKETGQATMFDLFGAEVATPLSGIDLESAPVPRAEVLAWEKELLGVWLTEHPFTQAAPHVVPYVTALCNEITPELIGELPAQGRDFVIAGIVGSTRRLTTRDGRGFIAAEVQDLSGSYEVTVWPDVYERTPEFWAPGSILLMQVRIRERGDRLSAGIQDVVQFTEDFLPPAWAVNLGVGQTGIRANAQQSPTSNGNDAYATAAAGNGVYSNGDGPNRTPYSPARPEALEARGSGSSDRNAAVAEPPFDTAPPEDPFAGFPAEDEDDESGYEPLPPSLASNAPTYVTSSAPVPAAPAAPLPPAAPTAVEPLHLVLEESGDDNDDQRRLATLFRLLQEQPGPDRVLLSIHTREHETIELALPSARLDDVLRRRLCDAVSGVAAAT